MTGIERLRKAARNCTEASIGGYTSVVSSVHAAALEDIADQIECEMRTKREHAADVSMSAYDLLTQEDRDAIAWVRVHGGLERVNRERECLYGVLRETCYRLDVEYFGVWATDAQSIWRETDKLKRLLGESVPRTAYDRHIARRQRQIDESHAALRRRNARIAELEQECDELREMVRSLNALTDEMEKRLMPEGMEWPTVDGKPVDFTTGYEPSLGVLEAVSIYSNGACEVMSHDGIIKGVDEIHISNPNVLDAYGAEIEVGDDLYSIEGGLKFHVSHIDRINGKIATDAMFSLDKWADPSLFTNRAPVIAADGKPLSDGEMVFDKDTGDRFEVNGFSDDGFVVCWDVDRCEADIEIKPDQLTHERPVVDTWERLEEDAKKLTCDYFGHDGGETCETCPGYMDSTPQGGRGCRYAQMADLVRRAKALAERDR